MPINLQETFLDSDGRFYPIVIGGERHEYISVTTVLDLGRTKGFLDQWEHEMLELLGVDGMKKYMRRKADEGTALHTLIERYLAERAKAHPQPLDRKELKDIPDVTNLVWRKLLRWQEWWDEENRKAPVSVDWMEKVVHSEAHQLAGRSDGRMKLEDGTWIIDYKSGKSQEKHKMQLAAYIKMEEEMTGEKLTGGLILSLGEETRSGWKTTEIRNDKVHKNSSRGESEVDHYFRGFMNLKQVVEWEFPKIGPNHRELPRYILPH